VAPPIQLKEYLVALAGDLVNELRPILEIRGVTDNSDLLGKYTEAAIRRLVHRIVDPMRVSTGAVIDYPAPPGKWRQIDLIIWAPFPAPAAFDVEGFGLVPRSSAFGVIEVKRTNYTDAIPDLEAFLADVEGRKIVADKITGIQEPRLPGIGIICVLENNISQKLRKLLEQEKVIAIFEKSEDSVEVRAKDILTLVNFLQFVSWRHRFQCGQMWFPVVKTKSL
jgi:hypothetical protein